MSNYTDVNTIRNGLLALKVFALSNANKYLENLAVRGLEALDRLSAAANAPLIDALKESQIALAEIASLAQQHNPKTGFYRPIDPYLAYSTVRTAFIHAKQAIEKTEG